MNFQIKCVELFKDKYFAAFYCCCIYYFVPTSDTFNLPYRVCVPIFCGMQDIDISLSLNLIHKTMIFPE